MRLPLAAWASITHRATGVILFAAIAVLLWMLGASLESPQSFAELQECMSSPLAKLVIWSIVAALIYHSVAGVKHLVADFGVGESLEGGIAGARIAIGLSVVLILLAGVWIW